ncbi:unnamed protein product [Ostreobium quekettii]|uniref:SBP-type domain-containing protein n=1 Tax=Ostreobium quekettii TaxID=121088 RepID=A0A8S1J2F8_9CHLO|nr:unnamed protein product [Ostreobium quekettii]|eukprot:evm.model.scf_733EXC.3 EVM.evm.TU.scf_733EXC.3   scf_733EXC:32161-36616(-)
MDHLLNLLPAEEENSTWRVQDWHWDPCKMEAEPVERRPSSSRRHNRGPVVCQVDGCGADLSGLKEYHQRYKICEYHLKVSSIVKDGAQQRFCQQCGRFHGLSEFDGVKRSCRARLERHNARRRKKSDSQTPSAKIRSVGHCKDEKTPVSSGEYDMDVEMHSAPAGEGASLSSGDRRGQPLPHLLQMPHGPTKGSLIEQYFYNDEDVSMAPEAPRAAVEALQVDLPAAEVRQEADPVAEVFRNFATSTEARDLFAALARNEGQGHQNATLVTLSEVLFPPAERGLAGRPLSMQAVPRPTAFVGPTMVRSGVGAEYLTAGPMSQGMPQGILVQDVAKTEDTRGVLPDERADLQGTAADSVGPGGTVPFELVNQGGSSAFYDSLLRLTSLSVKVFNCTPGNLPAALRRELLNAVRGGLVPEGYMRPGCVQLTLDVAQERATLLLNDSVNQVVSRMVEGEDEVFWKNYHLLVQLADQVAIVREGAVIHSFCREEQPDLFPTVQRPSPLCILNEPGKKFTVRGKRISGLEDTLLCRIRGRYVSIDVDYDAHKDRDDVEAVECEILEDCPAGVLRIEAMHMGTLSSGPRVLLTANDPEVVAEVCSLEMEQMPDECLDSFLHDMGRVLEFREWVLARYDVSNPAATTGEVASWEYTVEEMVAIVHTARRLASFALERDWTAVPETVLPVALLGAGSVAEVTSLCKAGRSDLSGLMRLAVESEKHCLVHFLWAWAEQAGCPLAARSLSDSKGGPECLLPLCPSVQETVKQHGPGSHALSESKPHSQVQNACCASQMVDERALLGLQSGAEEICRRELLQQAALFSSVAGAKTPGMAADGLPCADQHQGNVQDECSAAPVINKPIDSGTLKTPALHSIKDRHQNKPGISIPASVECAQLGNDGNDGSAARTPLQDYKNRVPIRVGKGWVMNNHREKKTTETIWQFARKSACLLSAGTILDSLEQTGCKSIGTISC